MKTAAHARLEQFALTNYEAGGHWVAECFGPEDYDEYINEARGNLEVAEALLKDYWELVNERERDCAWDGPSDGTADAEALASAGWGTDEDYDHYAAE